MYDLLIQNGKVVTPEGITEDVIAVKDGKIAAVFSAEAAAGKAAETGAGKAAEAKRVIDAAGNYVFPGFIDTHAHLNDPGYEWREQYDCGTAAAAVGGFTTVIDMPVQNEPAVIDGVSFDKKVETAEQKAYIDYALWGGLVPDNFDKLAEMDKRGCAAFKSFLSPTSPGFEPLNYGEAYEAMEVIREFGGRAGFHCEDFSMITHQEARMKKAGRTDWQGFLDSRPVAAEMVATVAIIELAKATGCKVHICHVSSPDVAEKIREAQKQGYDITAETCPHYLSMTKEELLEHGALFKCAPPLRSREDVERLWDYVKNGTFSGIGSDHSPAAYAEKFVEINGKKIQNAFDPWGGMSGLQTTVQTVFYEGCVRRELSPSVLADVMCRKAAKAFGIYGQKGDIRPGFDADFVILDPQKEWEVRAEDLLYLNPISSAVGKKGKGAPVMTIVRGEIAAENGAVTGKKGHGTLVKKKHW